MLENFQLHLLKCWYSECYYNKYNSAKLRGLNTSFSKKVNLIRRSASSQCLILYRKMQSCKLSLQGERNFVTVV